MSFQLNTATALPAEVQLGKEKPQAAFCLRSRYSLSANTASSWNAGTTLSIPLQTGTPGTFTDVKQGIIQATLQITNTNPYVDFLNFGPSGALIFFDEMRVFSSGTPIEENLRYSETADLLTIQAGHQCKPFHVYRRNKWRAYEGRAGVHHINFIKPSMVDSMGVPMFGRTPFMDKNSAVYAPPSIAFGNASNASQYASYSLLTDTGTSQDGVGPLPDGNQSGGFCDDAWAGVLDAYEDNTYNYNPTVGQSRNAEFDLPHRGLNANSYLYWTQVGRRRNTENVAHASAAFYSPAQWPDYQPCTLMGEFDDDEIDRIEGKAKISEYIKYLCNVRSLPIGVAGNVPEYGYQLSTTALSAPAANQSGETDKALRFLQYRVSMPFLSGIYGIFADKMFPDMLIGANNIRIEFKLAQNYKALWTTMDPCRRVPGTMRDFIPFTGSKSGANRFRPDIKDPTTAALGCTYVGVADSSGTTDSSLIRNSEVFASKCCLGEDLQQPFYYIKGTVVSSVLEVYSGALDVGDTKRGYTSIFSNLPKPQYIPCSQPWLKGYSDAAVPVITTPTPVTYINERQSCFGTYLPASQPQSRRCWQNTKLECVGDNYSNSGTTSFTIRDIQYIGEQVQLDDVVTSAIIQSAATSEIVVWTRGYRSFEASCDQNTQQNIILPIQIGQAEALYLVFRPSIVTQSIDYYSNSFYCPFVGLSYDKVGIPTIGGKECDVGGNYKIESSLDTSGQGAFSYQLFSGTKQYPLQPIQTVTELIAEREKSVHSLHNWDYCSTETMALSLWSKRYGNATSTYGLDFDPFIDLGYFTTFVPVLALDDQTITQNPYFQVVELSESETGSLQETSRIRGYRCATTTSVTASNSGVKYTGVLNEFISPIGTFFLGWDFESWTNHQDVMRSGKFLGQEQVSIRMTGTYLCSATNVLSVGQAAQSQSIMCTAIVPHVVKLSFIPGGHLLSYY